jgi:hypothetical protein
MDFIHKKQQPQLQVLPPNVVTVIGYSNLIFPAASNALIDKE